VLQPVYRGDEAGNSVARSRSASHVTDAATGCFATQTNKNVQCLLGGGMWVCVVCGQVGAFFAAEGVCFSNAIYAACLVRAGRKGGGSGSGAAGVAACAYAAGS